MSNEWCTIVGFNIDRPFDHSLFAPDLTHIYKSCHSKKTINRDIILHKRTQVRGERRREEKKRKGRIISSSTTAGVLSAT
ncbi:hypothetical protein MA16_Dca009005 [Dendrobium catenatum]|uniref:Uncharacterized protein n=1 Tax=Dendrobium catenatum TaxID=906689 RepID=A0A2I0VRA0_9ASPA|nr:hypothetical protein MA16_Dca009005 [Dendrobium catenatum]